MLPWLLGKGWIGRCKQGPVSCCRQELLTAKTVEVEGGERELLCTFYGQ